MQILDSSLFCLKKFVTVNFANAKIYSTLSFSSGNDVSGHVEFYTALDSDEGLEFFFRFLKQELKLSVVDHVSERPFLHLGMNPRSD
jgi:hypothetical protein